jgi:hypothetical protein
MNARIHGEIRPRRALAELDFLRMGPRVAEIKPPAGRGGAHEIAKLLLEQADSFLRRAEGIRSALALGMPLEEIEDYLDWLDALNGKAIPHDPGSRP